MVEYRKIKNIEGLTDKTEPQISKPIPETTGISNAVTTFENKNVKMNMIPQSRLTSNCWLVQMNGFESCTNCEFYPFNRKSGSLLKRSDCGGGQTLALMIYKTFHGSIMDSWKAHEYWEKHKDSAFAQFVDAMQKEHAFRYSINRYKKHIFNLHHIEQEQEQHKHIVPLHQKYPYMQIVEQYMNRTDKNGYPKLLFRKSAHYFTQYKQCTCENDPLAHSKYKIAYRDVAFQLSEYVTIYYYHQHAIVLEDKTNKTLTVDSCGYRTCTTKERINWYIGNHVVSQSHNIWYVYNRNTEQELEFFDGITLKIEGSQ